MKLVITLCFLFSSILSTHAAFASELKRFHFNCLEDGIDMGNNNHWATIGYDSSHWPLRQLDKLKKTGTICWVRLFIHVKDKLDTAQHKGVLVSQVGAYEVYWDGHLIGKSGKLGSNKATEIPGPLKTYQPIPDSLYTVGYHILGLKSSNYHRLSVDEQYHKDIQQLYEDVKNEQRQVITSGEFDDDIEI